MYDWLDYKWFLPATLHSFDWENEWVLYLIPFVPLLFVLRWLLFIKFRQKLEVAFFEKQLPSDPTALLRHVPKIFLSLFVALILVALARPQQTNEQVERWTEGIEIVLTIDISESMLIEDFKPNRLEAAKEIATNFIKGRFQDRIGIVVFSGDAYSLAPLTSDYELLHRHIKDISHRLIQKGGTAIGNALGVAINRLRESKTKSKVIILLSDGSNNAGSLDPITAAKLARAFNCKVYTIAIGKDGEVPIRDQFGQIHYINNTLDETTLRETAQIGEGRFFRASSNRALADVFNTIDNLEKSEIKENRFRDTQDFYYVYLIWGIVSFLIWLLTKNTFLHNALED
jgi:Ca-activated chloride channel family protein